jgi:hypothetical protein
MTSSGVLKCVTAELNCFVGSNDKHKNTTLYDALK